MSKDSGTPPPPSGQFLVYQTEDGKLKIGVRFEGETVWLTQQHMAELFQTTKQNIGQHLKSIFAEGELVQDSVVKDSFATAADGKNYATRFYNLDAIISVGYRVKSAVATRFRIWATRLLREYIVKGFLLDDDRLKNPDQPFDYFDELMRRVPMHMGRLDREVERLPDLERPRHPHPCGADLARDGPGQGRVGIRQVQGKSPSHSYGARRISSNDQIVQNQ
jgi:hypothetical protein